MLKKIGFIGTFLLGVFAIPSLSAQGNCGAPCEQPCGECYCKYVRYEPCCYNKKRCVEECIPCSKKCCRYVDQYYNVQRCRYVPQYYTVQVQKCRYVPEYYCEQKCCKVPEYYDVQQYKTCKKTICEPCTTYVPRYYWKRECNMNSCNGR